MPSSKELRKSLKNVTQDMVKNSLITSAVESIRSTAVQEINKRLDDVSAICTKMLQERAALTQTMLEAQDKNIQAQDKRAKAIQGFIMNEVKFTISNDLHNADVTLQAFQEVLGEKLLGLLGLEDIKAFNTLVDEKKKEISKRIEEKAVEAQQAAIKAEEANKLNASASE